MTGLLFSVGVPQGDIWCGTLNIGLFILLNKIFWNPLNFGCHSW